MNRGLLHCKGGANWYFFSASSVFPFKESHSVESQSFSRVHCMSHHHVRGGGPQRKGLEGETRKVGWREGEPSSLASQHDEFLFFLLGIFSRLVSLYPPTVFWRKWCGGNFLASSYLASSYCLSLIANSSTARWSTNHLPGLCQVGCSIGAALGFFSYMFVDLS